LSVDPEDPFSQPGLFDQSARNEQGGTSCVPSLVVTMVAESVKAPVAADDPTAAAMAAMASISKPDGKLVTKKISVRTKRADRGGRVVKSAPSAAEPQAKVAPSNPADMALSDQYLSVKQVAKHYSVGVATVWRWLSAGDGFPAPIRLSAGTTRWRESDLLAFEVAKRADL